MREATMDTAPRGWGWTWIVTILGTALCMVLVGWINSLAGGAGNLLITAALAAPLLFLLSNGVRRMARARRQRTISASTDALTGLLNRQAFSKAADAYLSALADSGRPGSGALLAVDIDNLKAINDAFDHETGDEAIRTVAQTIRAAIRGTDLIGRLSGEEFGILLIGTDQIQSQMVADRLCRAVDDTRFTVEDVEQQLTVSVGIGLFREGTALPDLVTAADRALYAAKQNGRNRVAISPVQSQKLQIAA
jgi:diguanylate cyclase (GGDEF)-like protein